MKELNDMVLGVSLLRDFVVVYTKCQTAMGDTRNAVIQLKVHMNKIKILLGGSLIQRLAPNIIAPKDLKIYIGQITK